MQIRLAETSDFEGACALYRQLGGKLAVLEGVDGKARWQELLNHQGSFVFVGDDNRFITSIISLHLLPNMTNMGRPYAMIENVVTDSEHRGKGIGRKVMQAAIEYAWEKNAYKIMLLTGKDREDGGAVGFYERLGFRGDEKHAMTMRKVPPRS
jgi:GNAT superfamily N-acetyltransferase